MISKKVKLRITFLFFLFLSLVLIVFLILKSLEENVVYFKSPTEIQNLSELTKKKVRIGGMVKKNSIQIKGLGSLKTEILGLSYTYDLFRKRECSSSR